MSYQGPERRTSTHTKSWGDGTSSWIMVIIGTIIASLTVWGTTASFATIMSTEKRLTTIEVRMEELGKVKSLVDIMVKTQLYKASNLPLDDIRKEYVKEGVK